MHIFFKYSLIEELKNIIDLLTHKNKYANLRSVIYPSLLKFITSSKIQKRRIVQIQKVWEKIEPQFGDFLFKQDLYLEVSKIVCYVHTFGCEGWFDIDKNEIHVRTEESSLKNTIDSIMHETIHLPTYTSEATYKEREDLVEKYMQMKQIQELLVI